ncbi:MAG: nitrilase-related carbon-nitrogen hydrolase [bacterium]
MKAKPVLKVATVQFEMKQDDKAANLATMARFIARAAAEGADIVAFPEMCLTGYNYLFECTPRKLNAIGEDAARGPSVRKVYAMAKRHGIVVAFGLLEKAADGLFNTYVVVTPDRGVIFKHRKIHAFENSAISQGSQLDVFELFGWKMGVLICYDNNLPENPRVLCLKGAEVIFAPHQTGAFDMSSRGMGRIPLDLWRNRDRDPASLQQAIEGPKGYQWIAKWLPSRPYDNNLFYVFANGVGIDGPEVRVGCSMILDPEGIILAETKRAGDDMIVASLNRDARVRTVCSGHLKARRPSMYGKIVEAVTELDTRSVRNELTSHKIK